MNSHTFAPFDSRAINDSANELYGSSSGLAPKATIFTESAFAEPYLSGGNVDLGLLEHSGSSFSSVLHSGENVADAYSYAVERDFGKRQQQGWTTQAAAGGYRKLWQQITKVQPGQRLQDNAETYAELTVEDLLRIIISLPPSESVINGIAAGLAHLDSSALAALLKELSKQGYVKRAVELFDWLRALDDTDELKNLCDVYTYTTMISTCTHQQQLRRALELVAEMRTKGIKCNVHTYSSLMNVCIKSNELDLALDVYKQMIAEGCAPNLVTFNTLVDLHVKAGQWEEAVKVLDTLEAQGIQAEVRTYNTIITACSKAGQAEEALKLYDRMVGAGIRPSATTYTALISAYGKKGRVEKAMDIYQDMIRKGCERNVITYSSLISACERAGRCELAIDLLNKMHLENIRPNVVTYNSLIAACAHGGNWQKADEFFCQMPQQGCKPDSITYSALISAYQRAGQWKRALRAFEDMQADGLHPDSVVFNTLLEVLWQSGVALAQMRAAQLWSAANRSGQFRIYIQSKQDPVNLQHNCMCSTAGAAIVTILRWLVELRNKVSKDGPLVLKERVFFTLSKAKQNRAEQPLERLFEQLQAVLQGYDAPFAIQLLDTAVHLEVASAELAAWLKSAAFAPLLHLVQGSAARRLTSEQLLHEDNVVQMRCESAYTAVCQHEEAHLHLLLAPNLGPQALVQRSQMVHLAIKYGTSLGLKLDTVYDGLELFNRVLALTSPQLNVQLWPLVLVACLLIAGRQGEHLGYLPPYEHVALITGCSAEHVYSMERNVYVWVGNDTSAISPLRVAQLLLERLGHHLGEPKAAAAFNKELQATMLRIASSPLFVTYRASLVAAAALYALRRAHHLAPAWPHALAELTGHWALREGELSACITNVEALLGQGIAAPQQLQQQQPQQQPLPQQQQPPQQL